MFMLPNCSAVCGASDPTKDTVRLDATALAKSQALMEDENERLIKLRQEEELARLQFEKEEAKRVEAEQRRLFELEQERLEEERKLREAREREERARREREEQVQREEQARRETEIRRTREELERAEAAQEAELERMAAKERERKAAVAIFLKENGFTDGVGGKKRSFLKVSATYPLHCAAKAGNVRMLEMLLQEGADVSQKNSSGKTAAQVAEKANRNNSHAAAISVLAGATCRGSAGGA
mmetsp:Transcript_23263/g.58752  ORF Transcript_23263/g.58752 Transcript_23263/m.58752 type:complete len:241 (+) Transcript_23263:80-802(+)|eukprot:CAMPEP_0115288138 /NCGR_PEP_ID=MMETSP0270-20121206/62817_1 /TAXON_ID=71861 /ORGANISM="Scrippsiella trochoidea, Strain CCMP3099" /LENGTH=240 /DNA_ID=CAMNT_0002705233 /DNA_START=92 /DNA_END=814 /DNA_ORIENTATION=-